MAANPKLVRKGFVFELRRGIFHVLLDGNDVASIEWKQAIEVPIEPGHHTLQVTSDRYSSNERSFNTADGEIVNFLCNGRRSWPASVVTIVKPNLALKLTRRPYGGSELERQSADTWLPTHELP